jgi:hypothetical protein
LRATTDAYPVPTVYRCVALEISGNRCDVNRDLRGEKRKNPGFRWETRVNNGGAREIETKQLFPLKSTVLHVKSTRMPTSVPTNSSPSFVDGDWGFTSAKENPPKRVFSQWQPVLISGFVAFPSATQLAMLPSSQFGMETSERWSPQFSRISLRTHHQVKQLWGDGWGSNPWQSGSQPEALPLSYRHTKTV